MNGHFSLQQGYGAFSYSKSNAKNVINYFENQEVHHHTKTFVEEYHDFLETFDVDFDEQHILKPVEWAED